MSTSAPTYVLLTGATGFIGAHILDRLLSLGLRVRATARSPAKAALLLASRPTHAHLLDTIITGDLADPNSFANAFSNGIDAVIHTASPLDYSLPDLENDVIIPAITGATSIVNAAIAVQAGGNSIKRIVLTSSFAAVLDINRGPGPGWTYSAKDWNPITYDEGVTGGKNQAYRAGKTHAEKAAWAIVDAAGMRSKLVTICPPMVFGPPVHPLPQGLEGLNETMGLMWHAALGEDVEESRVSAWVDVRDLAEMHVQALLREEVGGRRYAMASEERFSWQWVRDVVWERWPEWVAARGGIKGEVGKRAPEGWGVDNEDVVKDLGAQFRGFEECVIDSVTKLRELEEEEERKAKEGAVEKKK